MIKKLKHRFILINFSLLFSILLTILGGTYYLMSEVTKSQSIKFMETVAKSDGSFLKPTPFFQEGGRPFKNNDDSEFIPHSFDDVMKKNSFTILLDKNETIIQIISNEETEVMLVSGNDLVSQTLEKQVKIGTLTYNNQELRYLIQNRPYGSIMVFLDRSFEMVSANQLALVLLLIGTPMLIILFVISVFLASWAIKPVDLAWTKQKQFVADASHELKTPLAVIETTTDVLIANASETIESQSKWLNYIKIETDRMSKLISNLLYLAKVDNNETNQTFFEFNLSESITNACLPLESLIFETGQHFDFEIEPNLFFTGEEESIKQVAIILLDNAMKYCPVEGQIKVALYNSGQGINLSVSNTGDGIAPEHLSKIFERFYRVDDSRTRETGGYGLGLSIAKSIVKQHHGTIFVTSVPNELTTFKVSLPVKK